MVFLENVSGILWVTHSFRKRKALVIHSDFKDYENWLAANDTGAPINVSKVTSCYIQYHLTLSWLKLVQQNGFYPPFWQRSKWQVMKVSKMSSHKPSVVAAQVSMGIWYHVKMDVTSLCYTQRSEWTGKHSNEVIVSRSQNILSWSWLKRIQRVDLFSDWTHSPAMISTVLWPTELISGSQWNPLGFPLKPEVAFEI